MTWKKFSAILLTGAIALFGINYTVQAALPSIGESDARIQFVPATDAPDIVDPTDPTQPFDRNNPENPTDAPTGNTGPLTLDYVSSIDFGENEISAVNEVYESISMKPFIQVTDRRGTAAGWTVTAQASNFTNAEQNESLTGTVITLNNGEALPSAGTSAAPTSVQSVVLAAGGDAAQIISAPANTGVGTWINRWFPSAAGPTNNSVTLEVPAGSATVGAHTATITWTLTDAPGQ